MLTRPSSRRAIVLRLACLGLLLALPPQVRGHVGPLTEHLTITIEQEENVTTPAGTFCARRAFFDGRGAGQSPLVCARREPGGGGTRVGP
jgi:hypothetical protein